MCGRYYVEDPAAPKGIRDICPSGMAEVLLAEGDGLVSVKMLWGFPATQGQGLLINARAETVCEKKTFRESFLHRRCLIPARGFYEWNKKREKYTFERKDSRPLFLAGCYDLVENQKRFVILTTRANAWAAPVHDRMPLILEPEDAKAWVTDEKAAREILRKIPAALRSETEYEQLTLF